MQHSPVQGPDRRAQLLDAADRAVMREGPQVSMNAIAAEAGITKPVLYRHFGDKGGLYKALAERHIEALVARLRAALSGPGPARSRAAAAIDAYLALVEARPQVYRFLMHRARVEDERVRGQLADFLRRLAEELAAGLAPGPAGRAAEPVRALAWAHGVVGMVQAAGDWWLEERPVDRATMVGYLADLLGGAPYGWAA